MTLDWFEGRMDEVRAREQAAQQAERPFKVDVHIPSPEEWVSNELRFATAEEAQRYGIDLLGRWFQPDKFRVVDTRTGLTV